MQLPSSENGFLTAMNPLLCHSAKQVWTAAALTSEMVRFMGLLRLSDLVMDGFSKNSKRKRKKYWIM
jgi:hypothetical protein